MLPDVESQPDVADEDGDDGGRESLAAIAGRVGPGTVTSSDSRVWSASNGAVATGV